MGLHKTIALAIEDLDDLLKDITPDDRGTVEDQIFEIADSATPIYYSEVFECVSDDIGLILVRPENVGSEDSPVDMIQENIRIMILDALYEHIDDWENDFQWTEDEEDELWIDSVTAEE